ncbi:MAG: cytochrome c [Chloroflexi bacterium]|nr:cytochrome c [Chloroflexota bacterium]
MVRARQLLAALGLLLIAACTPQPNTPPGPDPATLSPGAAAGKALIYQRNCGGCHTIPGIPGAEGIVGPNLAGVASRTTLAGGVVPNNNPDDLKNWIQHPDSLKPGTGMPNLGLSDQQATQIVAYLELLK